MSYLDLPYLDNQDQTLVLKPLQVTIAQRIGQQSGLVELPTGSGKSIIMLMLICKHLAAGRKNILVLAPKILLVEQHYRLIERYIKYRCHAAWATDKTRTQYLELAGVIVVSTPHTMYHDCKKYDLTQFFQVVLLDEVHHVSQGYPYTFLASWPAIKVGFSAHIPASHRSDIYKALAIAPHCVSETVAATIHEQVITLPCSAQHRAALTIIDRIRARRYALYHRAVPNSKRYHDPLQYIMSNKIVIPSLMQMVAKDLRLSHLQRLIGAQTNAMVKTYLRTTTISKLFMASQCPQGRIVYAMLEALSDSDQKLQRIDALLKELAYRRCIVFSKYRQNARYIYQRLSKTRPCLLLMGQGTDATGTRYTRSKQIEILTQFRTQVNLLVSTTVADQGLDIPNADLIICYEPPATKLKYIQRRGRTGRNELAGAVLYLGVLGTEDQRALKRLRLI